MKNKLSKVNCKYGAPMGRHNTIPVDAHTAGKLHLQKLQWVDWDYDEGGAYWGKSDGDNIYRSWGETNTSELEVFVRAKSRVDAKTKITKLVNDFIPFGNNIVRFHK